MPLFGKLRVSERRVADRGDTLIELLIALTVIALTAVALLGAFTTSISASSDYKNLSSLDAVLKSFVETTTHQLELQQQPPAVTPQFVPCAAVNADGSGTYSTIVMTEGNYKADLTGIEYWTTGGWTSDATQCITAPPSQELLTATATNTVNNTTESIQFAVSDPAFNPANPASPEFTSAASDTVSIGLTSTFSVTATGQPTPTLSAAGLPPGSPCWVCFSDQGGGNGTLVITPPANAASSSPYTFTLSASNSVATTNQTFTLTIATAPVFTSANGDTVTPTSAPSFTVQVTGNPTATLTQTGLPMPWASFTDNSNNTGTLSFPGTPVVGSYPVTFSAVNSAGTISQTFTLTVNPAASPPTFTTPLSETVPPNEAVSFTVTATGNPAPTLSAGTLPNGFSFNSGTASGGSISGTLQGTPTVPNTTYTIVFTASNSAGPVQQSFQLIVGPKSTPAISYPTSSTQYKVKHGTGFTLTITGSGFICTPEATVTLTLDGNGNNGNGNGNGNGNNTPIPVPVSSCSQGSITITGTAPGNGTYDLSVQNPDGGMALESEAFVATSN